MNYYNLISIMPKGAGYDADAQAFITATGISGTNANAINQLVLDLKAASIWTKFKAVYPFVGGTATAHKFNLKNPADTDAAFRLAFSGGLTHSSSGILGGGVNGLADTFLDPTTVLTQTNCHISANIYTNTFSGSSKVHLCSDNSSTPIGLFAVTSTLERSSMGSSFLNTTVTASTHRGFWATSRNSTGTNGVSYLIALGTILNYTSSSSFASANIKLFGATSGAAGYSNFGYSFFTIGDALTDLESLILKQITEKYQVALGRNTVPTQSFYYNSAYNNETNAFLFSTQITNATIQTATNTLVNDLKTANIWTKMKAVYPMVGGTATTHKFNLVNPQDTNAAFRLNFVGGWTHSSTGALPNGTNAYADTFLTPSTAYSVATSGHMSYYSRTDSNGSNEREIGSLTSAYSDLSLRYSNTAHMRWGETSVPTSVTSLNSLGFYIGSRTTNTISKIFKNGTQILISGNIAGGLPSVPFYIGCLNINNSPSFYSAKQCAFASIGDGLTDAEALALYNATQTFNTTLGRQV